MKISQDPIKSVYQSFNQFWSHVAAAYEKGKYASWSERRKKDIIAEFKLLRKQQRNCMHASSNVKTYVQAVLQMMT